MMARRWARRDRLVLRLPPRFATLEPGELIELTGSPTRWQVHRSTIDGLVAVVELRPVWRAQAALAAEPGRSLATHDIVGGELTMALVELPDLSGETASTSNLYLAGSTPTAGWKPVSVEVSCGPFLASGRTANRKAVMGHATTMMTDVSVEVRLIDEDQWLNSCDDRDLTGGANLALVGDEVVQFGDVEPLGAGEFRLTGLRRGLAGTEWALADHAIGDLFLLISPASMQPIALPIGPKGSSISVTHPRTGTRATTTRRSLEAGVRRKGAVIAPASGGTTIDAEAREAIAQILTALRRYRLIDA